MKKEKRTDLKNLVALSAALIVAHPKLSEHLASDDGSLEAETRISDMALSLLEFLDDAANAVAADRVLIESSEIDQEDDAQE